MAGPPVYGFWTEGPHRNIEPTASSSMCLDERRKPSVSFSKVVRASASKCSSGASGSVGDLPSFFLLLNHSHPGTA